MKARNPNIEILNKSKGSKFKITKREEVLNLKHLEFDIVSDLEFRISNF